MASWNSTADWLVSSVLPMQKMIAMQRAMHMLLYHRLP